MNAFFNHWKTISFVTKVKILFLKIKPLSILVVRLGFVTKNDLSAGKNQF
jgi:hypothetical protein